MEALSRVPWARLRLDLTLAHLPAARSRFLAQVLPGQRQVCWLSVEELSHRPASRFPAAPARLTLVLEAPSASAATYSSTLRARSICRAATSTQPPST